MTRKAFVAVAESSRFASWFVPGLKDRDFFLSYGFEAPDLKDYELSSYWMAGGFAARFQRAGLAGNLTAPGQEWLSSIDESLLGRHIVTGSLSEMPEDVPLWAKPAEAKIDAMVAGRYTKTDVAKIFVDEYLPVHTNFQWTEDILRMNHEHRFYVLNDSIVTGSPYLIDGIVYNGDMVSPLYREAQKFAEDALKELGDNRPPAFTLDVGFNEITEQWLIVEANPAWSSGIYGCDPATVIEVLDVACNGHDERWKWVPADYLVQKALIAPQVRIFGNDENTAGIFKYSS